MAADAVLAILGGGSAFTPALAAELARAADRLPPLDVRLHGRDPARLAAIAGFCTALAAAHGAAHRYTGTVDLAAAARGAAIVVNQMRIGGFAGRTHDETFPLAHGLPGDETIGPGGLASAIRSVPAVLAAARTIAAVAEHPWFVNLTNPMGILVRALLDVPGVRPFGLCELPAAVLERALQLVGAARADVDVDYFGVNHQGWFTRLERDGRDLLPALAAALASSPRQPLFPLPPDTLLAERAVPMPYLRLYAQRAAEVRALAQRSQSRGAELAALSRELHAAWSAWQPGRAPRLPEALTRRPLPWLRLAVVPCVEALLGGAGRELYVTMPNGGVQPGLPDDAPVELRCTVDRAGPRAHALQRAPRAEHVQFTARIVEFERLALLAAHARTPTAIAAALAAHPFGVDAATAARLCAPILQEVS